MQFVFLVKDPITAVSFAVLIRESKILEQLRWKGPLDVSGLTAPLL